MTYKHASIVPLIGGETIAQENVLVQNLNIF